MKIKIQLYQKAWKDQFERIRTELDGLLGELDPVIEHIGSTSIEGLPAKPIIDINVGVNSEADFGDVVERMATRKDYIYYKVFNETLPQRRLFVKLKDATDVYGLPQVFEQLDGIPHEAINDIRIAHVHVWVYGKEDWVRHIAFRDYVRAHEAVKKEYGQLKQKLSRKEWAHGMEYNQGKDVFIKKVEREAMAWYRG